MSAKEPVCAWCWNAPRIPTPGTIGTREYRLVGDPLRGVGGILINSASVPQECVLPKGHNGDHRSLSNVTAPGRPAAVSDGRARNPPGPDEQEVKA